MLRRENKVCGAVARLSPPCYKNRRHGWHGKSSKMSGTYHLRMLKVLVMQNNLVKGCVKKIPPSAKPHGHHVAQDFEFPEVQVSTSRLQDQL